METRRSTRTAVRPQAPRSTLLMMGAVGALLGLGSLVILSLTHGATAEPTRQVPAATPIQGAQALRLDLLRQASWPFAPRNHPYRFADRAAGRIDHSGPHPAPTVDPAAGSRAAAIRVVREFYQWLHSDPAAALSLVSADLLGDEATAVARSWAEVAAVRPRQVWVQPDGSVVAEVLARYSDGGRLLLRHHFALQTGPAPKIVRIELLTCRSFSTP